MDHSIGGIRTERCFRSTTRDQPILCKRREFVLSEVSEVNLNEANTGNGNYRVFFFITSSSAVSLSRM